MTGVQTCALPIWGGHDRYANLSAEAFLQARKSFDGVVILAGSSQSTGGVPSGLGHEVRFPLSKHKSGEVAK